MAAEGRRRLLSGDASVLIDFVHADRGVLALVSAHVGELHVISPVLREVAGLSEAECIEMGVVIVEPTFPQLEEAGLHRSALSFEDKLCLILARDGGMTCLTNDRPLLRACDEMEIPTMRGLRALLELVGAGRLSRAEASALAERMSALNPRHLSTRTIAVFRRELDVVGRGDT